MIRAFLNRQIARAGIVLSNIVGNRFLFSVEFPMTRLGL